MDLQQWLLSLGFNFVPILDGKRHRCDESGTKKSDHIWYIGSIEMMIGGKERTTLTIGNWKTDEQWYYSSGKPSEYSDEERAYYAKKQKEASEKQEREKREGWERAAREAEELYRTAGPADPKHQYLIRKQIGKEATGGIRQSGDTLLIPMRDIDGKLWGIQRIWPDDSKKFLVGQRTIGLYFRLPEATSTETSIICEGYATAASIHLATGSAVYCAFNAGNLCAVTREVSVHNQNARIIICGDDDRWNPSGKNIGREKATEAANAVGGIAVFPEFHDPNSEINRVTDFNDLMVLEGIDEVRTQIETKANIQPYQSSDGRNNRGEGVDSSKQDEAIFHGSENQEEQNQTKNKWGNGQYGFPHKSLGPIVSPVIESIADKISVPIEMVASSVLAGMAICVQEHYNLFAYGGIKPVSLFFITIANSGDRKTTVDNLVLGPHNTWRKAKFKEFEKEKAKYKSEMEEYKEAQLKKQSKTPKPKSPKAPMLFASSPTIEGLFFCLKYHRDSVGLFSDEGGSWLGGYSMKQENVKSTLAQLNLLWDGKDFERIRRGKEDEGEIDSLQNKRVSLHIMIQSKLADELFGNEYAKSQGFLARCLTCNPKSRVGNRKFLYEIDLGPEMKQYEERVWFFLNKQKTENSVVLNPTLGAIKAVEDFFNEIELPQSSGGELSFISDYAAKIPEHCIRIAAVITAFNNPNATEIDEETMRGAIEIGRFYLENQTATTEKSAVFPSKDSEVLYNILLRRLNWKLRDLERVCPRRFRIKKRLIPLIDELASMGYCNFDKNTRCVNLPD